MEYQYIKSSTGNQNFPYKLLFRLKCAQELETDLGAYKILFLFFFHTKASFEYHFLCEFLERRKWIFDPKLLFSLG